MAALAARGVDTPAMSRRRQPVQKVLPWDAAPPPDETPMQTDAIKPRGKPGRPRKPDTRRHRLRIGCNDEELLKFRLLSSLNHGLNINTMARDIILDEVNALLGDHPRKKLIALLHAKGLTDGAIDALLKSI